MKRLEMTFCAMILLFAVGCAGNNDRTSDEEYVSQVWVADNGDGTYKNPILYADYSDPDVCRVGDDYYMTSSSFNCVPGLQILHSKDLVNWSLVGAALPNGLYGGVEVGVPEHGNCVWAPCIRYHSGYYYIYWGDPDRGIYMVKTSDPAGEWDEPVLVKDGKGLIDPSPLWDDDGRAWLVHGIAGSRAELKSVLMVCEMNFEGTKAITPSRIVYDGHDDNPTIEGPKFHKRNGKYYIFAPAGGVSTGWQLVLRGESPYGPFEEKVVMAQGDSKVNGPHQGAWVDTQTGQDWFVHFQDVDAWGRLVHLQPMEWVAGWPVIGYDANGDGCGEPVETWKKPYMLKVFPIETPAESDEFESMTLGLQWQWHAAPSEKWVYCAGPELGYIRLYSYSVPENYVNLWDVGNLLLQKMPAPEFVATTKVEFMPSPAYTGERAGLVVMGRNYAAITMENTPSGLVLSQVSCLKADGGKTEKVHASMPLIDGAIHLRVVCSEDNGCTFYYSQDGREFVQFGETFKAREGKWIGAKVGLFCTRPAAKRNDGGFLQADWFRITKE